MPDEQPYPIDLAFDADIIMGHSKLCTHACDCRCHREPPNDKCDNCYCTPCPICLFGIEPLFYDEHLVICHLAEVVIDIPLEDTPDGNPGGTGVLDAYYGFKEHRPRPAI